MVGLPLLPPGHVQWHAGMTTFRHLTPHSSVPMGLNEAKCNLGKVKLKACIPACFDTVGAPHSLQGHLLACRAMWYSYVLSHALSRFTTLIPSSPSSLVSIKINGLGKYSPLTLSM